MATENLKPAHSLGAHGSPAASIITQPSAHLGLDHDRHGPTAAVAALFLHQAHGRKLLTAPIVLMGIGVVVVGVLPDNNHNIIRFSPCSRSCAVVFPQPARGTSRGGRLACSPWCCVISLFFLVAGNSLLEGTLGAGGVERWIAYPIVLWMVGSGNHVQGHHGFEARTARDAASPGSLRGELNPERGQ
jgi:hypothetical protein